MGRIRDQFLNQEPTFESRMLYAMYTNKYDDNAESAWAYLDAAKELLESYKPIEQLEEYINEFEASQDVIDEYDSSYIHAYRELIKKEKSKKGTND